MLATNRNIVERQWSTTTRGLVHMQPGWQFRLYIMNLTPKNVDQRIFMKFGSVSNGPKCILQACKLKPFKKADAALILTNWDKTNTLNADNYKQPKWQDEQVDRLNTIKNSD